MYSRAMSFKRKALIMFFAACSVSFTNLRSSAAELDAVLKKVRAGLAPLDIATVQKHSASDEAFLEFYGLNIDGSKHWLGTIDSEPFKIAMHVFEPSAPKGTVLIVHGYYDHSGVWKHAIRRLVADGYRVVAYDQPGHGISSGARAAINDFSQYQSVFVDCLTVCRDSFGGPVHVAAHSTGCSVVMDYLLAGDDQALGRVVMIAPLVRSVAWKLSGVGLRLVGSVMKQVPRKFRRNSSDKEFLKFVKKDPLQPRKVPMSWAKAHRAWAARVAKSKPVERELLVIQGTKDSTVDWKYNLPLIKKLLPGAKVQKIEKGGHQLMNESEKLRTETLDLMSEWIAVSSH